VAWPSICDATGKRRRLTRSPELTTAATAAFLLVDEGVFTVVETALPPEPALAEDLATDASVEDVFGLAAPAASLTAMAC
jgi:hypothetical protein